MRQTSSRQAEGGTRVAPDSAASASRQRPSRGGIIGLQRTAGNRAVARMLEAAVQRDADDEEEAGSAGGETVPRLDPTLEAQLRELFPIRQGPTFEAITTSTGAQSTSGELTEEALRLWRRERISLDESYRRAGEERRLRPNAGGPDVVPTRGGQEGPATSSNRWGLLLAVWDYRNVQGRDEGPSLPGLPDDRRRRSGNLPEIRDLLRDGSPYQRAAEGSYDHHESVENPTAAGIVAAIHETVTRLADGLVEGEEAHLTVNFQGHGGRGAISGVDGRSVNRGTLRTFAELARERGVHVTYVLDTCNAGSLALLAENMELFDLAEGAAGLSPEAQAELQRRGQALIPIFHHGLLLNDIATDLRYARVGTDDERDEARTLLQRGRDSIRALSEHARVHPEVEGLSELSLIAMDADVSFAVLAATSQFRRGQLFRARERLAPLLDGLNDLLGREVAEIRSQLPRRSPTR